MTATDKKPLGCFIVETLNGEVILEKSRYYPGLTNLEVIAAHEQAFGEGSLPAKLKEALLLKRLGC